MWLSKMKWLIIIGLVVVGMATAAANVVALVWILAALDHSGDVGISAAFISLVALIVLDVLAGAAIWNRVRRHVAPMFRR